MKRRSGDHVYFNEPISSRRAVAIVVALMVGVLLLPQGVEAAAPALMRLVDGDGSSKVQVDGGRIRVGDGDGPLTVNGKVSVNQPVTVSGQTTLKPGVLLANGYCGPATSQTTTDTLDVGSVVTSIVFTGPINNYAGSRLDIFPGTDTTDHKTALMSLKNNVGNDFGGPQNEIYASDVGFKVTGAEAWTIVCSAQVSGNGHNGALYSVFGYPAP